MPDSECDESTIERQCSVILPGTELHANVYIETCILWTEHEFLIHRAYKLHTAHELHKGHADQFPGQLYTYSSQIP